ncbi:uncharacterized protein [Miscanthus floridulus]|uniref:uncharacterized protein isoform X2 n=1 Tax=Miscanthus floridulus TaxID=154761 RepID=UPI00345AB552
MENYVDVAYSVHKFQAAYDGMIPVITDKSQWSTVDKGFKLLPPIGKERGLGRQRKKRILGCLERSGKATRQVTCKGCGELGHRRTSWRCPLSVTKKGRGQGRQSQRKGQGDDMDTETAPPSPNPPAAPEPETAAQAPSPRTPRKRAALAPSPMTPRTRVAAKKEREAAEAATRMLDLEPPQPLEMIIAEAEHPPKSAPAKKLTPRKKLATKIKKSPAKGT